MLNTFEENGVSQGDLIEQQGDSDWWRTAAATDEVVVDDDWTAFDDD